MFFTVNMAYTRSQNYTNKTVGEPEIQTYEVVVVVLLIMLLSFNVFVPTSAHPLLFLDEWFVQRYLNVSCSPISFNHLSLLYPFLKPRLTT